ncbi:DUF924 family protein [Ferrovibrio sp.]|uniref:DUF924 family protein n=1 Tax=Ferrovibrio sp. TaxID=1917215 RepID=UPI003D121A5E
MLPEATFADAASITAFWRAAGPQSWFSKNAAFDDVFRARFLSLHEQAARGELDHWLDDAEGALALLLLLDQFPRNCFRGSPRMYASDAQARAAAARVIETGLDLRIEPELRLFIYLPFAHSEALADQDYSVALQRPLGEEPLRHAEGHRDIIRGFGRFPHRNEILGRISTPEEAAFLAAGGFAG